MTVDEKANSQMDTIIKVTSKYVGSRMDELDQSIWEPVWGHGDSHVIRPLWSLHQFMGMWEYILQFQPYLPRPPIYGPWKNGCSPTKYPPPPVFDGPFYNVLNSLIIYEHSPL